MRILLRQYKSNLKSKFRQRKEKNDLNIIESITKIILIKRQKECVKISIIMKTKT